MSYLPEFLVVGLAYDFKCPHHFYIDINTDNKIINYYLMNIPNTIYSIGSSTMLNEIFIEENSNGLVKILTIKDYIIPDNIEDINEWSYLIRRLLKLKAFI